MATMNILVLVKSFVFFGSVCTGAAQMSKEDAKSHAEASRFHFHCVGSSDAVEVCVYNGLNLFLV